MADLSDLTADLERMGSSYKSKKGKLMKDMGNGLKRKIQDNTPVDTGRLKNSYQVQAENDSVEVYSTLDYAQPVNEGHVAGSSFVPGKHMYDLGIMQFESESDKIVDDFLDSIKGIGD